jgi:hypothetical protein
MNTKESLLKRLFDARFTCYKHHMSHNELGARIAAQFAVDDMNSTYNRYVREISEVSAMEQLIMEVEDIEKAAKGYQS